MAPSEQQVMTVDELQASREYRACSPKQQFWLTTLIANGFDYTHATVTAFDCRNTKTAQIYSYALRRAPKVQACLDLILGRTDRDRFLEKLQKNIDASEPGSVAAQRLLALYAKVVLGDTSEITPTETTPAEPMPYKFKVGDICVQNCRKYRVTAVDENGKPTEGDPL